jgi:KDO2-lipid IV(A) lauroyltransferase
MTQPAKSSGSPSKAVDSKGVLDEYCFQWQFLAPKYWLLWLWFGLLWCISRLPYRLFCIIAESIGLLAMKMSSTRLYFAERNVELCFPELSQAQRAVIVRDSFKGAGMALFESGLVWWPNNSLKKKVEILGLEHIHQAQQAGRNIMLFVPHVTCLEPCFALFSNHVPVNILFRVHDNPLWEYMAGRGRRSYQIRMMPRKKVGEFLNMMNEGIPGLIAADQDMGKKRSLFIPFFGIPAATIPSVASFAEQTDAEVMFISAYRRHRQGYTVEVHPPLQNFPSADVEADCVITNQLVEDFVRQHPSDYLWQHRRFKTRPEGDKSLYDRKKKKKNKKS